MNKSLEAAKKIDLGTCGCLRDHIVNGIHCPEHICDKHKEIARVFDTLHAQQPCDKLRTQIRELLTWQGQTIPVYNDEFFHAREVREYVEQILAQPCQQPASVGSEEEEYNLFLGGLHSNARFGWTLAKFKTVKEWLVTRNTALAQTCQQPASDPIEALEQVGKERQGIVNVAQPGTVGSEEWIYEAEDEDKEVWCLIGNGKTIAMFDDEPEIQFMLKKVCDAHNAALRKVQSAPVEAIQRGATYTYNELRERVKLMSNTNLIFSNQYGMLFILNDKNEVLLTITSLCRVTQGEQK